MYVFTEVTLEMFSDAMERSRPGAFRPAVLRQLFHRLCTVAARKPEPMRVDLVKLGLDYQEVSYADAYEEADQGLVIDSYGEPDNDSAHAEVLRELQERYTDAFDTHMGTFVYRV